MPRLDGRGDRRRGRAEASTQPVDYGSGRHLASAREPEDALGDDVALDLRRARVDGLRLRPHPTVLPPAVLDRIRRARRQRAIKTLNANRRLLDALVHLAPVQLGERRFRSRCLAMLGAGQVPETDETEYMCFDLSLRDFLADGGVRAGAAIA